MPKTAFQLIVLEDAFDKEDDRELKFFLVEHFYTQLQFKQMAALMYE